MKGVEVALDLSSLIWVAKKTQHYYDVVIKYNKRTDGRSHDY